MMSIFRKLARSYPPQAAGHPSITCRGIPITHEDLFGYTNGHFLVNQEYQTRRRYVKFDVDALCDVAAAAGGNSSRIVAIEKMEGGFSKALLMKKANGMEVIAKIPCRIAGPSILTTAGEVGVLEYVKQHTSVPVPRVLAWSSDSSNAVQAEYIIMEKASGVQLFQRWGEMTVTEKLQLIQNLSQLEAQFAAIKFPCYGGLYPRRAVTQAATAIDSQIDPSGTFCIGPSCDRSIHSDRAVDNGPWKSVSGIGLAIVENERLRLSTRQDRTLSKFGRETQEQQMRLLEIAALFIQQFDTNRNIQASSQPMLWHTDLHMGNIFVDPNESARITALIDLQSLQVLPAFLQARWPEFLKPPPKYDYPSGMVQPRLPDDFDDLDEESKGLALQELAQAKLAKAYEASLFLENKAAHIAMTAPRVFRELFTRCGEVSEVGMVPLRECLIELTANWASLGFVGDPPYSFTEEEIVAHETEFDRYQAWANVHSFAEQCLETDSDGWIAPQLDITEQRKKNERLMNKYVAEASKTLPVDEARANWPFPVDE
ncbi:hypothetical protein K461DRAFT_288330 [Myriangium duriaei CBS 260.36]|uniref:Altered inheritance of mitochondria protein 9, mitochondrial n=1 Tax=Myriangium duriaei CBS 260.36 TaxID=1168546 RepID=A0A9P4IY75_9PEZI|nr:hypothetical protein K461DRAFT_288330 [Myriangium duriaei CBS 260.36]